MNIEWMRKHELLVAVESLNVLVEIKKYELWNSRVEIHCYEFKPLNYDIKSRVASLNPWVQKSWNQWKFRKTAWRTS